MKFPNCRACIFDAYGTLFNLNIPLGEINELASGKGAELLSIWRTKQLEYTWLRTAMDAYVPFSQVTKDALTYAMRETGLDNSRLYDVLLPVYQTPVAFPEVKPLLFKLKERGILTAVLSNGTLDMLEAGIKNSELRELIDYIFTADEVKVYKPRREVYQMALDGLDLKKDEVVFFSSNTWDVAGAAYFGLNSVWIKRNESNRDILPGEPLAILKNLGEVPNILPENNML